MDERTKKLWYIHTMESFSEKLMELEIIMLNEISQTQKEKYHVFSDMQNLNLNQADKQKDMNIKGGLFVVGDLQE
jgi:hypothetical protein